MKTKRDFTLVELLMVITVISILSAMLLPVLKQAVQSARTVGCVNNLKGALVATQLYHDDYRLFFPVWNGGWPNNPWYSPFILEPYTDKNVFFCPASEVFYSDGARYVQFGNYGINLNLCHTPWRLGKIHNPGKLMMWSDYGFYYSRRDYTLSPPNEHHYLPGATTNLTVSFPASRERDAKDGRHPQRKVCVAFCDQHVESMSADNLTADKYHWYEDHWESKR
jgi:prepilin-type N-terminal cleavage/methylation domain-containing protein